MDGVSNLIDTLRHHRSSVKLQRQGCWALLTIAGSDEGARAVAESGGIQAVMNAMMDYKYASSSIIHNVES